MKKVEINNLNYQHIRCSLNKLENISLGHSSTIINAKKTNFYLFVVLLIIALMLLYVERYEITLFIEKNSQKIIPNISQDKSQLFEAKLDIVI